MMRADASPSAPIMLLYDGTCGICQRMAQRAMMHLEKKGLRTAPLQDEWTRTRLNLPEEELLRTVRLILPSGEVREGADVFRFGFRQIWWTTPLYLISILPLARNVFDSCYAMFARNRHLISHTCGL
jgi:predicted DCC family thiol-disulfide oxidoreductase YuxK